MLLWGDRWHFPGREASETFRDWSHAGEILIANFAEEPKPVRLRLLFQPDSLESVAVACPHGDRRVLAFALSGEYPALRDPSMAWGHEPVMPQGDGFATVLHIEKEPALIALATQLAKYGLAVESAWPLVTFLHALPDDWTDSGAATIMAIRDGSAVAYHHPKSAGRSVLNWRGEHCLKEAGRWLTGLFAEDAAEPITLVCADDESAEAVAACLGDGDHPGLEVLRVSEALGRPVVLPRYHPAQLLPREPVVTAQRMAIAAGIALLLAAGGAGLSYGHHRLAVRSDLEQRQGQLANLRTEVAHLRANAAEIADLRSRVERGTAGPPAGLLLRKLSTVIPQELVLSGFKLEGRAFEVSGWASPSAPAGLLERWRQVIAPPDAPWKLALRSSAGGAFSASGEFRP